jgi:hypothetical protein
VAWNKEVEQSYTYSADPASSTPFEGDFAPVDTGTFKLTHSTDTATANKFVADLVYTPAATTASTPAGRRHPDRLWHQPHAQCHAGQCQRQRRHHHHPKLVGIETLNGAFTGSGSPL